MKPQGILVIACGALARELRDLTQIHDVGDITVECLPAQLHNRPEKIPGLLRTRLEAAKHAYDHILVGYADCGTGGLLDAVCEEFGVERLPGSHCYEFFAGHQRFAAINDDDPTAFYLTDYLAKHFDRLIMDGLGITAHPELRDTYFGNYTRMVLRAQTGDPAVDAAAEEAAARLGLPLERVETGYGELETSVLSFVDVPSRLPASGR